MKSIKHGYLFFTITKHSFTYLASLRSASFSIEGYIYSLNIFIRSG